MPYPEQEGNSTAILNTNQMNLFGIRFVARWISDLHSLEKGRVEHDPQDAIRSHDHASGLFVLLAFRYFHIHLECANTTLLPFLVRKLEKLRFAAEVRLFLFLACLNCGRKKRRQFEAVRYE
jgi:hypothetical protein